MKWTAIGLFFFLTPILQAQTMNTPPHGPIDSASTSTAPWIDMVPIQPFPAAHSPQPVKPVSVDELLLPPKALKEIQRSQKAFEAGDLRASNEHLEKALRIYPDLTEARYDLGGNYLRLHEYEKALPQLQQFVDRYPDRSQGHYGLAVTFFLLQRYREAEASARRALELEPDPVDYRYILGNALIAQGHDTDEAKQLLRQSEAKFPNASLLLAQVFWNERKIDDVVTELQAYLRAPDPVNKASAECWLAILNGAATGACAAGKTFPDFR
jgi:tetratricopeptide (TPR) repeat protein